MPRDRLFVRFLIAQVVLSLAALIWWSAAEPPQAQAGLIPGPSKKTTFTYDSNKDKITVWQYEPPKPGKYPALVMLYGIECLAEPPAHYEFLAQRFAGKGYVVQMLHYFNCTPVPKDDVASLQKRIKDSLNPKPAGAEDALVKKHFQDWMTAVKVGVEQLAKRDNVDPERVSLVGFSLGGFVAMSLAADDQLKVAAVVECFGGLPKELHANYKSKAPVLIFHGDKDEVVPVQEAHSLKALLKEKNCTCEDKIFPDARHMFLNADGKSLNFGQVLEAEDICFKFLERHVKNGKNDNGKAPK